MSTNIINHNFVLKILQLRYCHNNKLNKEVKQICKKKKKHCELKKIAKRITITPITAATVGAGIKVRSTARKCTCNLAQTRNSYTPS